MSNSAAAMFRRLEFINFNGDPIRMFKDESDEIIWVSLRDVIEAIGIPLDSEFNRLEGNRQVVRDLCITNIDVYDKSGTKVRDLFIPNHVINDYLWGIPEGILQDHAYGNLQTYRREFAIEIHDEWTRRRGSLSAIDPGKMRRAIYIHSLEELRRAICSLGSFFDMEGLESDDFENQVCNRITSYVRLLVKPSGIQSIDAMNPQEVSMVSTGYMLYRNLILLYIDKNMHRDPDTFLRDCDNVITLKFKSTCELLSMQLRLDSSI